MASSDGKLIRLHRLPDVPPRGPFRFGDFEFDARLVELRRRGQVVSASTFSLSLLDYLLCHRDRVVGREELVQHVWRGVIVNEGSLRQAIWELRQTLDDSADEQLVIRTVRGRGYRFVAVLHEPRLRAEIESVSVAAKSRSPSFFGRTAELEHLRRSLREATREAGRVCAIVGAPGMGKTRLARELTQGAVEQAVSCFEAAADPDGVAPAFWPWLQLVRTCLEDVEPTREAALEARFPGAFRLLRPAPEAPPQAAPTLDESPSREQFAILTELSGLLLATLGETPTLLLLEDLHWADEASLALLRHFLLLLPRTRALLVVTCRAQRARDNRPLSRTLEAIARSATGSQLELVSLRLEEVAGLLAHYAGTPVPAEISAEVFELSRGNPLFASQLAHLLARSEAPLKGLPLEFGAVIQRRLQQLPDAALATLLAASQLGPEFCLAEIAALLEESPREALSRIDLCIDHGLVLDSSLARGFCFVHPLVREAAYALVSHSERCRLHRLAGEWLEQSGVDARGTRLHELAHHFFHAAATGCSDKAARYTLRCAQLAYAATAYKEAVSHFDRALSCMDLDARVGAAEKLEVALLRGEALRASGADTTRVNREFLVLAERAESLGFAAIFARAVLGYTGQRALRFTPTRFAASSNLEETDLIERALRAVGDEPTQLRALLLCSLMASLLYSTERARRERAAAEATKIAAQLALPSVSVRVLTLKVYCCAGPQAGDERLATCDQLLAIADQSGLREQEADCLITRAVCHLSRGDTLHASQDERRARMLAAGSASAKVRVRSELLDLMRALWEGDLPTAKQLTQRALDVAPDDVAERSIYMLRSLSLRMMESAQLVESVALYESMLGAFPSAVGLHCGLASGHATLGDRDAALRHFDIAAQDDFRALPEDLGWLGEMAMLADAACVLDDRERAALVYARLSPYGAVFDFFMGEVGPLGPIAYWLALLAITLGDLALARSWLAVAQDLNQRIGASMLHHYALLIEARICFLSDPRELSRARALIGEVETFAAQRGLSWLSGRARHAELQLTGKSEVPDYMQRK